MLRFSIMALGLGLLVQPAWAETEPVLRITGFGVVAAVEVGDRELSTVTGSELVRTVDDVRLVRRTDQIKARLCGRFGMLFVADNLAEGEVAEVTIRSTHPGLLNNDGVSSTGLTYPSAIEGTRPGYVGFTFDQPWELVAGPWTFAVLYHDRVLVEQRFDVTIPEDGGRPLAGACSVPTS